MQRFYRHETIIIIIYLQQQMLNLHLCPDWDGALQNMVDAVRAVCVLISLILFD